MAVLPLNSNVIGAARAEMSAVGSDSTRRCARGPDVECGPSGFDSMGEGFVDIVALSYSIVAVGGRKDR